MATRLETLRAKRSSDRQQQLGLLLSRVEGGAREFQVSILPFGSFAEGRAGARWDLDVMVLGKPDGALRRIIARRIEQEAGRMELPVDLVFEDEFLTLRSSLNGTSDKN